MSQWTQCQIVRIFEKIASMPVVMNYLVRACDLRALHVAQDFALFKIAQSCLVHDNKPQYLRLLYVLLLACRTRHYMSCSHAVMQQRWMTSSKLMLNKEVLYRRPAHCTILIHAFIMSKLDYCNSLLSGLREDHITKFQLMQILPHAR